jgi:hypothetical protein
MKRVSGIFAPSALVLAAALACGAAHATENFDLRYAPGIGGADMSAPVEPGMYLQVPLWVYHTEGDVVSHSAVSLGLANPALAPLGNADVAVKTRLKIDVQALLPRFTYMTTTQLWGATVGYTALLPLIQKKADLSVSGITASVSATQAAAIDGALGAGASTLVTSGIASSPLVAASANAAAATGTGSSGFNVGDLEVGVMLRWQKDEDQYLLVPNFIFPTGQYDKTDALNGIPSASAGKFYSFRPTFQYSHIGDGWDFGTRVSLTFNTRNTDTKYHSGNYANVDWALMKDLPNQFRAGLEGYIISQWTADSLKDRAPTLAQEATLGQKGSAYAAGPGISWIKGAGELLVEGRVMKEFAGSGRPHDGYNFWINIAKPFL